MRPQARWKGVLRLTGKTVFTLLLLLTAIWATLALWYRLPLPTLPRALAAGTWAFGTLCTIALVWCGRTGAGVTAYALACAGLLFWWSGIEPSNDRRWADDVARQLVGTMDGDVVTLQNVRNFDWRSDEDYTPRWEIRRYKLSNMRTVDVALSYWMGPAIAHTLVSFGFDDERGGTDYVSFSVEIRKERGESFSAIAGFFKQFELGLVAADERDVLRVRTNVRNEDVYLYNVRMSEGAMRSLFLSYVEEAASLRETPRFYDTLTANCTTIVFEMARRIVPGLPLDYRLLASGYLPEYLFDIGALDQRNDLEALRTPGRITERARRADGSPDFSRMIRHGVPGHALANE